LGFGRVWGFGGGEEKLNKQKKPNHNKTNEHLALVSWRLVFMPSQAEWVRTPRSSCSGL
jgi:hypothetical protein